ncbi:MAG: GH25 family lysozyme [Sciscionella sp.]
MAVVLGQVTAADANPAAGHRAPAGTEAVAIQPDGTDHAMGSQIRRHESISDTVDSTGDSIGNNLMNGKRTQLAATQTPGLDVSHWQGKVNWPAAAANGARFAYVKATEGTGYTDPTFDYQYTGSYRAGLIRGAYHFALPNVSTGTRQADYFIAHGGGWSADGHTLPGALDLEYNPYGKTCYGKSKAAMAAWVAGFSRRYHKRTGRWPVIYTSARWWGRCLGTTHSFAGTSRLWIARYNSSIGALPYKWGTHTIWQYSSTPITRTRSTEHCPECAHWPEASPALSEVNASSFHGINLR